MANINIENFVNILKDAFPECEIRTEISKKINCPGHTIIMSIPEKKVSPAIYWESVRAVLEENGGDIPSVIENIRKSIEEAPPSYDWIADYEFVKDKIFVFVCSSQSNNMECYLHRTIAGDICEYYRIIGDDSLSGRKETYASIPIQRSFLEMWGITEDQLREDALRNSQEQRPFRIKTMWDAFKEMLDLDDGDEVPDTIPPMWTVSNKQQLHGASVITYSNFFEEVRENVRDNCYLLPATIHEVLLVPAGKVEHNIEAMTNMVREINAFEVQPQDKLSDNVYFVDIENESIYCAS